MRVYTRDDASKLQEEVKKGAVFIYPTDTIYGIGCVATNEDSVLKVRELKGRDTKPFSVIAPSKQWIRENCEVDEESLSKLPGPYTLIVKLKKQAVCQANNGGLDTLGVRIPDHWISDFVRDIARPIVTTSVNLTGQPPSTEMDQLKKFEVDFILYEGPILGKPSTIIDLTKGKITERP